MIPILNPKRFYRSTIKIMSLMLLASCAIHAADNDSNNVVPSTTSTQTTTTAQCNMEPVEQENTRLFLQKICQKISQQAIAEIKGLPNELAHYILQDFTQQEFQSFVKSSEIPKEMVIAYRQLSEEIKEQADAHIDKMFGGYHDSENKKSIAELIKDSFNPNDLTCLELYRSCAHMTEFPYDTLIKLLIDSFPNNPLNILNVIIHHKAFLRRNMYIHEITGIIKALARHSAEQIAAIGAHASQLFTEGMNGYERAQIITALARLYRGYEWI